MSSFAYLNAPTFSFTGSIFFCSLPNAGVIAHRKLDAATRNAVIASRFFISWVRRAFVWEKAAMSNLSGGHFLQRKQADQPERITSFIYGQLSAVRLIVHSKTGRSTAWKCASTGCKRWRVQIPP